MYFMHSNIKFINTRYRGCLIIPSTMAIFSNNILFSGHHGAVHKSMVVLQVPPQSANVKGIMDNAGMCWRRIFAQCQSNVGVQLTLKTRGLVKMAAVLVQRCGSTVITQTTLIPSYRTAQASQADKEFLGCQ